MMIHLGGLGNTVDVYSCTVNGNSFTTIDPATDGQGGDCTYIATVDNSVDPGIQSGQAGTICAGGACGPDITCDSAGHCTTTSTTPSTGGATGSTGSTGSTGGGGQVTGTPGGTGLPTGGSTTQGTGIGTKGSGSGVGAGTGSGTGGNQTPTSSTVVWWLLGFGAFFVLLTSVSASKGRR